MSDKGASRQDEEDDIGRAADSPVKAVVKDDSLDEIDRELLDN